MEGQGEASLNSQDEPTRFAADPPARRIEASPTDVDVEEPTERYLRVEGILTTDADAAYRWNLQTNQFAYLSPAFARVANLHPEDVSALGLEELLFRIHQDDRLKVGAQIESILSGGDTVIEFRFLDKDGQYRWLADRTRVLLDAEGRPCYRVGAIRDVTERKLGETVVMVPERTIRPAETPVGGRRRTRQNDLTWMAAVAAMVLVVMAGAEIYRVHYRTQPGAPALPTAAAPQRLDGRAGAEGTAPHANLSTAKAEAAQQGASPSIARASAARKSKVRSAIFRPRRTEPAVRVQAAAALPPASSSFSPYPPLPSSVQTIPVRSVSRAYLIQPIASDPPNGR